MHVHVELSVGESPTAVIERFVLCRIALAIRVVVNTHEVLFYDMLKT